MGSPENLNDAGNAVSLRGHGMVQDGVMNHAVHVARNARSLRPSLYRICARSEPGCVRGAHRGEMARARAWGGESARVCGGAIFTHDGAACGWRLEPAEWL